MSRRRCAFCDDLAADQPGQLCAAHWREMELKTREQKHEPVAASGSEAMLQLYACALARQSVYGNPREQALAAFSGIAGLAGPQPGKLIH